MEAILQQAMLVTAVPAWICLLFALYRLGVLEVKTRRAVDRVNEVRCASEQFALRQGAAIRELEAWSGRLSRNEAAIERLWQHTARLNLMEKDVRKLRKERRTKEGE